MDEFIKSFKSFLYRDIFYILGGSTVILSFLYFLDLVQILKLETPLLVFGIGISYVIGYTVQETFSCNAVEILDTEKS